MSRIKFSEMPHIRAQSELIEHILGVIDTRLQLIDFKTKQMMSSFIDLETMQPKPHRFGMKIPSMESVVANNEKVLQQIEIYSKTVKVLLTIRAKVNVQNAFIVLYILEDNKFLNFKEDVIVRMLAMNFNEIKDKKFEEIYAMAC